MDRRFHYRLARQKHADQQVGMEQARAFLEALEGALVTRSIGYHITPGQHGYEDYLAANWQDADHPTIVGDIFVQVREDGYSTGMAATCEITEDTEDTYAEQDMLEPSMAYEFAAVWKQLADTVYERNRGGQ